MTDSGVFPESSVEVLSSITYSGSTNNSILEVVDMMRVLGQGLYEIVDQQAVMETKGIISTCFGRYFDQS